MIKALSDGSQARASTATRTVARADRQNSKREDATVTPPVVHPTEHSLSPPLLPRHRLPSNPP
eukprot:8372536-Pyramimonas_sp.AAC.1